MKNMIMLTIAILLSTIQLQAQVGEVNTDLNTTIEQGKAIDVKTAPAPAKKKGRAALRNEIIEVEDDDNEFAIFTYEDGEVSFGYFMSMGREYKISELLIDREFSNTLITGFTESCLILGSTYDEAYATLDSLLALYDEEVGTTTEFPCRLSKGAEGVGDLSTATCVVRKKTFGGKRLLFTFISGNRQAEAYLDKSVVKELRMGMRLDRKLHHK